MNDRGKEQRERERERANCAMQRRGNFLTMEDVEKEV